MKKLGIFSTLLIAATLVSAQTNTATSTIRGIVIDQQSQYPIPGAHIVLLGVDPIRGATTDADGRFRLIEIPVGRQSIQITYIGYESQTVTNLLVNSGKDTEINFELVETVTEMAAVEITAREKKSEAGNEMSTVSARSFSIEEAQRFSGTLQDPARMAQNYAGVSNASDDRNDIVIRGNSPVGLLWRLEGIDIPSPNHFSTLGTTGGPISMLNINNLGKSDFMTSAFAPEYGNAVAGVFDLRLRSGNRDEREYTGQIGFNGAELGLEGPFRKGGSATYIINYRYSFLDVMNALGINFGTGNAIPEYQDVNFRVDLPTTAAGRFSVFGIGGTSFIDFKPEEASEDNLYATDRQHQQFESTTAIAGISHSYFFNDHTQGKLVLGYSTTGNSGWIDTLDAARVAYRWFGLDNSQDKYSAHYFINSKINAQNTVKAGAIYEIYNFEAKDSLLNDEGKFFLRRNEADQTALARAYVQWQFRPTDRWTFNAGIHSQFLTLNDHYAIEPRLGLRYKLNDRQSVSAGAGLHSQMQPIVMYYNREEMDNGTVVTNNRNLDFNKAAHMVLGYDNQLSEFFRLKTEVYYQYLYDQAVERTPSSFSIVNAGADFILPDNGDLVNEGTGTNYGLEITLERFLKKGFYVLFTTSLFESKYKGSDGIERNTTFNGNYVFNFLAGREWKIGRNNALTLDLKSTYAGGRWHAPVDLEASRAQGEEVKILSENNSLQYDPYFRTDFKIGFRMNRARYAQSFALDIRNVSNTQNVFIQNYDNTTKEIETVYQTGLFPILVWNIYF